MLTATISSSRFALANWQCRALLAILLAVGFFGHLRYLQGNCPIDLAGDEAQYWDWSTRLQSNYYSKGPLVALIIRGSCAIFGDTMQAVRYPALLIAAGISLCIYYLTSKLFKSELLALGTVLLSHFIPIFIAGSLLMTIDPPLMLCWALATCCAVKAIFDDSPCFWIAAGVFVGIGFLAKYAMPLWYIGLIIFLLIDRIARPQLRSRWFWLGIGTFALFTIPVLAWNMNNDWVSYKHVSTQTGVTGKFGFMLLGPISALAGQFGLINPFIAIAMIDGVFMTLRRSAGDQAAQASPWQQGQDLQTQDDPHRAMRFLLCIGGAFWGITMASSFIAKMQPNWPAPAYLTLLILAGYAIWEMMHIPTRRFHARVLAGGAIALGFALTPILHDPQMLIPALRQVNSHLQKPIRAAQVDFTSKLRGNSDLALHVASIMDDNEFVLCEDYQNTALLRFYMPGHPRTLYCGSFWADAKIRRRMTQYDLWDDCRLDAPSLLGRDAIYVGYLCDDITQAFASVQKLDEFVIERNGMELRRVPLYKARGFKGMTRPAGAHDH